MSTIPSQDFSQKEDKIVPQKFDVLCGRDKKAQTHVGNRRFRVIVGLYKERYQETTCRAEKKWITNEIVKAIRSCLGRFLKFDNSIQAWYDIGDDGAREKVSHALRERKGAAWSSKPPKLRTVQTHPIPQKEQQVSEEALNRSKSESFKDTIAVPKPFEMITFHHEHHQHDRPLPRIENPSRGQSSEATSEPNRYAGNTQDVQKLNQSFMSHTTTDSHKENVTFNQPLAALACQEPSDDNACSQETSFQKLLRVQKRMFQDMLILDSHQTSYA